MQTVLVTGGAGFIGSAFLNKYVPLFPDIQFVTLDALTYAGKLTNISASVHEASNFVFQQGDIRSVDCVESVYAKYNPTGVIHFAAESHVDNSIKNPKLFTETNVIGTQNLLDAHRRFSTGRFHHVSTDEVYGDIPESGFFVESTPLNPSSPYSASKAASDMLVCAYARTFGIDYTLTRCSNNYGPNQDEEKLIPRFISLLRQNKSVTLYGDGSNIRDWLYVEDHCDAIWEVFTRAQTGAIYNIGGNNEYTNLQITHFLLDILWKGEEFISFVEDRKGHDKRYAIDATKIKTDLGWEPKVAFPEGIKKTVAHYIAS